MSIGISFLDPSALRAGCWIDDSAAVVTLSVLAAALNDLCFRIDGPTAERTIVKIAKPRFKGAGPISEAAFNWVSGSATAAYWSLEMSALLVKRRPIFKGTYAGLGERDFRAMHQIIRASVSRLGRDLRVLAPDLSLVSVAEAVALYRNGLATRASEKELEWTMPGMRPGWLPANT